MKRSELKPGQVYAVGRGQHTSSYLPAILVSVDTLYATIRGYAAAPAVAKPYSSSYSSNSVGWLVAEGTHSGYEGLAKNEADVLKAVELGIVDKLAVLAADPAKAGLATTTSVTIGGIKLKLTLVTNLRNFQKTWAEHAEHEAAAQAASQERAIRDRQAREQREATVARVRKLIADKGLDNLVRVYDNGQIHIGLSQLETLLDERVQA